MKIPFVNIQRQTQAIRTEIDEVIKKVLDDAWYVGSPIIEAFEDDFKTWQGSDYVVACSNGTDAIEIALEALGIKQGDEVLVPAHTWISTASAVVRNGAIPVLVPTSGFTYVMDVKSIEGLISSKTKAIIPVHLAGCPVDMIALMQIANNYGLKVIEDCAQSHGAEIEGKKVGLFGDVATFSFYPSKNIGAFGHAGAITMNDPEVYEKAARIVDHGQSKKNTHHLIGRNSKIDTMQAAILQVKLKHIDAWNINRIKQANLYSELLSDSNITLPKCPVGYKHVYHLFITQVKNREVVIKKLLDEGIVAQIHYPNMLSQMDFFGQESKKGNYSVCHDYSSKIMSLPIDPFITDEEVRYVADIVKGIVD
jgi:dTDP-4-amino-4,6-dideoxygalactose transaminase